MSAATCRGDAAAGAWRVGLLWREGVRDDRIMTATIAGRLASAVYATLLSRICVLLIVCVFVLVGRSVRQQLMRLLAAVWVCGRGRHRRVLGFHSRRIGAMLRFDVHRQQEASLEDMRSRRGAAHVIAGGRGFPQERQDSCYIQLALSRLGRRSWAWPLPSRERAKARHRLGAE